MYSEKEKGGKKESSRKIAVYSRLPSLPTTHQMFAVCDPAFVLCFCKRVASCWDSCGP